MKGRLQMENEKVIVNFEDLCKLGFPPNQARTIIREAKSRLVSKGFGFYNGKRVGLVPFSVVSEIIGLSSLNKGEGRQ